MADATMRASDADRERIAAVLRDGLAAGRLTIEEFGQRLDQAYAAKTLGELDSLVTDLPAADLGQPPATSRLRSPGGPQAHPPAASPLPSGAPSWPAQAPSGRLAPAWRSAWGSWLGLSLLLFVIWLLSGSAGGPWFLWVVLPLGVLMLARWISGGPAHRGRRPS